MTGCSLKKCDAAPRQPDFTCQLNFKRMELADRPFLDAFLKRHPQNIFGYTFASLFAWDQDYRHDWAMCGDDTLILTAQLPGGPMQFIQPIGAFGSEAQASLLKMMEGMDYPAKIYDVSEEFIRKYPDFVSRFEVEDPRGSANYIYNATDLATLTGKFYAKKRNLISQAHRLYAWAVHPLSSADVPECLAVLDNMDKGPDEHNASRQHEENAVKRALENFSALGTQGVLIRVEGKAVAFSIYDPVNPEMVVIAFEKADRNYKGLYQIINQETAKTIAASGFSLINREQDMDVPGLRQAKLSYGPVKIAPSYTLHFRNG